MFKLDFKAEEPDIKLPTFAGSWRKKGNSRKTSTWASLTMLKPSCGSQPSVEILKKMGIPDHLTCLQRKLYVVQEATVRTRHRTTDWFKIGKRVQQGCVLPPCSFRLHAKYIMQNAGLNESQAGIKIVWRNINKPLDTFLFFF